MFRSQWTLLPPVLMLLVASPSHAQDRPAIPPNYHLVAHDDLGLDFKQPHLVVGENWTFGEESVRGDLAARTCAWDNNAVVMSYGKLDPAAAYKLEVVYTTEAGSARVQRLEANGQTVHGDLKLPAGEPGTFLFDVPKTAYANRQLELKFIHVGGANAVVSVVKVWSTSATKLSASGRASLWESDDPVEADWARQDSLRGRPTFDWQDADKALKDSVLPALDEALQRGQHLLSDLDQLGARREVLEHGMKELEAVRQQRAKLLQEAKSGKADSGAWRKLYLEARWAVRRLAFHNPLLKCDGLLFVRRYHPEYMHQCARRLGPASRPGGDLCILSPIAPDGSVRSLTRGLLPEGVYGRPDLSFDGKRILFGYAQARAKPVPFSEGAALQGTGYCYDFQVHEMALDGTGLRKLTEGPYENADPLYLPDGRIAFMSSRAGGLVQCGDWAIVYCVFTMDPDGSNVRQITKSKDGEWDPSLMEDGTILFTRWDYMMKFWSPIQFLWSVRPDGSNPKLIYGNNLFGPNPGPLNFAMARQIPGTSSIVCIGSAHHNTGAGPVCLVDCNWGRDGKPGLMRLTPVEYVETGEAARNNGFYDCPFSLSDKYFLVSYSFERSERASISYGLYLLDVYGGKELIYRDESLSCMFPTPLRPRRKPTPVSNPRSDRAEGEGTFLLLDVNEGLPASVRGEARYLRITEAHERKIHTRPYAIEVGPDSGFETKSVLGTVPIEKDGSAHFRIPAGKSVFFQVLDKDYLSLHVMRSVTNVQAGEVTACLGCHEPMQRGVPNRRAIAAARPASVIEPPAWGVEPLEFTKHVQPVLDNHCIRCHDGAAGPRKSFSLAGKQAGEFMTVPLTEAYTNLRRYVKHAPMFTYSLSPLSFGSRQSKVMQVLKQGHYEVRLDSASWQLLAAWIDCNAPFMGKYEVVAAQR